MPHKNVILLI